jgi:nucleoside-diphosphate-sugar epimerase
MTLSHVHNRPRMPDRVVVLGASGFLGRGLARASAAAGIETIGLGSREVDLAEDPPRQAVARWTSREPIDEPSQ